MANRLIHSVVAYSCKICKRYTSEDLLTTDGDNQIDLLPIIQNYATFINNCCVSIGSKRAIKLSEKIIVEKINNDIERIIFKPDAGKALENFKVVNTTNNSVNEYKGDENSAMYPHYVFCYIKNNKPIFIFHRYGHSGCKTIFEDSFNKFLKKENLISHFDIILSKEMFDDKRSYIPQKLRLLTTYSDISSDKTDNEGAPLKKTEKEVIISLDAPKAHNINEWIKSIGNKDPNIDELKTILIEDDYTSDFEEAKLSVKFGNAIRSVSLSEFSGLIGEYDITDKIEVMADGAIRESTFFPVVDEYAIELLKQV